MNVHEKTLVVLGESGAGKAAIIGSMLFKYGGIDMMTMQALEESPYRFDQAKEWLKELNITPKFYTPGRNHVTILDGYSAEADCIILVTAPNNLIQTDKHRILADAVSHAKKVIVLLNKMDAFDWSEEEFKKAAQQLITLSEKNGIDAARIPIIPVSALHGDNIVEASGKCTWYNGITLLKALVSSFKAQ